MKVVHIAAGNLAGGAARGAYWLHLGLLEQGCNSWFVTNDYSAPASARIINLNTNAISALRHYVLSRSNKALRLVYPKKSSGFFSTGLEGVSFENHEWIKDADIIHLHWINGLVSINQISKFKVPVVWSLRDMWAFTGGCHYSLGCERYKDSCGRCPQLNSGKERDVSHRVLTSKKIRLQESIYPVGISDWIARCAAESRLFRNRRVEVIHNGIDTMTFSPSEKSAARRALRIPEDKKVILIGAHSINDFYKGLDLFDKALGIMGRHDFLLLSFGKAQYTPALGGDVREDMTLNLGFINDDHVLANIYSAADVFVAPSRFDAFGKTVAEAMSCGTPVVCFDSTGPAEIVSHLETGYIAKSYDATDLAKGIVWVLDSEPSEYSYMCKKARKRATELFDVSVIAKKYLNLYASVTAE